MGVIELNGDLKRKHQRLYGSADIFDNIPDGAGDEKVLLDEPEFLARLNRIRGYKTWDRFRNDLLLDA
jgi:hypothetical protein